jgi:hypothetical protein
MTMLPKVDAVVNVVPLSRSTPQKGLSSANGFAAPE